MHRWLSIALLCLFAMPRPLPAAPTADDKIDSMRLYEDGRALELRGEENDALLKYFAAIEKDMHNVRAHLRYQRLMVKNKRFEFVEEYDSMYFDYKDDPLFNFIFGTALAHVSRPEKAKTYFEKAIQLDPNCYWAHNQLGTYFQFKGDYPRALDAYNRAIEINPRFADALTNRGILYLNMAGREPLQKVEFQRQAHEDLSAAIAVDPDNTEAHDARLKLLQDTFDTEGLEKALTDLIDRNPENPDYFLQRARAFLTRQDVERAMRDLDQTLSLKPTFTAARTLRAGLKLALKKTDEAFADYNLGCQMASTSAEPYEARGHAHVRMSNFSSAIADFTRAIENDPKTAAHYLNRGTTYMRAAPPQAEKAIEDFSTAIKFDRRYTAAYLNRGSAYASLNQWQAAAADFQAALQEAPDNAEAMMKLDRCYTELLAAGAEVQDEQRRLRQRRMDDLRAKLPGMSYPEKTILINETSKRLAEDFRQEGLDVLAELARDPDHRVRTVLAQRLGATGREQIRAVIESLRNDEHELVRGACTLAWVRSQGIQAVPLLIPMLADSSEYVRKEALRLLRLLTNQTFEIDAADAWRQWWDVYQANNGGEPK